MIQSKTDKKSRSIVRVPVLLGLFAGSATGLGFLLSGVPNVELMTLVVALSGAVLGPVCGFLCGVLSASAYSLGSPYGLPVPVLLAAQALGMGLAGVSGAVICRSILNQHAKKRHLRTAWIAGITGVVATLCYDLLTNLASIVAFDLAPLVVFTGGISYALLHMVSNAIVFTVILPAVLPRIAGLAKSPLVGQYRGVSILVLFCSLLFALPSGATPADNPETPQSPVTGNPNNWQRPLWHPFFENTVDWLFYNSPWNVTRDGGIGAAVRIMSEPGTSMSPMFLHKGLPVGTGHILADDPWLVPMQSFRFDKVQGGSDSWGGTGGVINLEPTDIAPQKAVSGYRGTRGQHESYMRSIFLLTPSSDWRIGFNFEEYLDNEGYNYTGQPSAALDEVGNTLGHGKVRLGSGKLVRRLGPGTELEVSYGTGRKTKDLLPAWGVKHQEIWSESVSVDTRGQTNNWDWRSAFFLNTRDVQWGDRFTSDEPPENSRTVESGLEGILIDFQQVLTSGEVANATVDTNNPKPIKTQARTHGLRLKLFATSWRLADSGYSDKFDKQYAGSGDGQTAAISAEREIGIGAINLKMGLTGHWDSYAGFGPEAMLELAGRGKNPGWSVNFAKSGRAARSDELLTAMTYSVADSLRYIYPSIDLEREKTLRLGLKLQKRLLGTNFAINARLRRLTNGITWQATETGGDIGQWANYLEMDSASVTASLAREGRFLGWGRAKIEGTWHSVDEKNGLAPIQLPETQMRFSLMWENHMFKEDGILQLALFGTFRGKMADPWDVSRDVILPEFSQYDLIAGFRLVGTTISMAFKNLTGQRQRLSSGSFTPGPETTMRLTWTFFY